MIRVYYPPTGRYIPGARGAARPTSIFHGGVLARSSSWCGALGRLVPSGLARRFLGFQSRSMSLGRWLCLSHPQWHLEVHR